MNKSDVLNLVSDLSSIDGISVSKTFPVRTRSYKEGYRVYVKYIFDDERCPQNLETLVKNGYDKRTVLRDHGYGVQKFMSSVIQPIIDKYSNLNITVNHNLSGMYGYDVWDEVTLTVKPASGIVGNPGHDLEESSEYVATPQALDRESMIQQLLDVSEDDNMTDFIFERAEYMINEYRIEANPDWDLADILDTFDTEHLEELLQYVMDYCKNQSMDENLESTESSTTVLTIEVMSGVNADGFTAIVTDSISGEEIFRQKYYYGYDASYDRRWASSRAPYVTDIINDLKSQYNVSDVEVTSGNNVFRGDSMSSDSVEKFKRNYLSENVTTVSEDDYDDCYESLFEDTQMTDAQRLALQELEYCLEYGEISQEEHDMGMNIQWDINSEDVVLFIAGMDTLGVSLSDIEHVEYGDCDESEFDGCYSVTMSNGSVKQYGWHDMDMTGALTAIEDSCCLSEDFDDGWEKRFDWANKYYKDSMIISGVRGYPDASKISHWHLESTRPAKHLGNFRSLEDAKAAGEKELARKNKANSAKEPQFGVHQFSTDSIIFRGTDRACGKFIDEHEELWDDAEVYMIMPDDPHYRNLDEDYARVDAKDFVKHPMNYDVTSMLSFEVEDGVKVYLHRGPGKQREFYIIIGDTYVQHSFNKIETVEKYLRKKKLVKESISESVQYKRRRELDKLKLHNRFQKADNLDDEF